MTMNPASDLDSSWNYSSASPRSTEEESTEESNPRQSSRLLNIPRLPSLKNVLQEHFVHHLVLLIAKIRGLQFFMQGSSAPVSESDTDTKIKSKFTTEEIHWSEATSDSDSTDESKSEVGYKDILVPDIENKVQFETDHKKDSESDYYYINMSDFDTCCTEESEPKSEPLKQSLDLTNARTQKCIHAARRRDLRVKRYVKRVKRFQRTESVSSSSSESAESESFCYQLVEELTPEILLKRNRSLWIAWKCTKLTMQEFISKSDAFLRVCTDIDRHPSPTLISDFIEYLDVVVRSVEEFITFSHKKLKKCKEFPLIRRQFDFWFYKINEIALETNKILSDILDAVEEA